jgi:hypothetical protein
METFGKTLNIPFELFGTLMLFAMLWLLFYQLNYQDRVQESKTKRILLIIWKRAIIIFFLFVKLISGYSARLLALEINKTPPLYTPQSGLSPEFIEKYGLSGRQVEITEALLRGKADKEISALLEIATSTVRVPRCGRTECIRVPRIRPRPRSQVPAPQLSGNPVMPFRCGLLHKPVQARSVRFF